METVTKFLIGAIVILVASIAAYYFIDQEALESEAPVQQEAIIEIGHEPDLVKNRLTHDEIRENVNLNENESCESEPRPFTGRG